ncbi:histidine--tRNA ligase [Flavisolibacter nicotianae]|uniref:histidine--tRNA ligase n=1 Tax=Flavisolibacter nicotianae TaxID=2364882 RepID=UPI000EB09E0B|nr:histidine--tRNA ligase [Flavisolibacter nicotianae]
MKPSLPQGTRDFGSDVVRKRHYIFNTIKTAFELYGFQPLETPAMENLETLMGKYGEEGDKLIFKILNNGLNDPKNIEKSRAAFANVLEGKNDKNLTERALRYDLTIPFARYVAMNHGQLTFPFKRYQIQPVWRADRPQRGRYREFYQCDADVVGSRSLLNEVELTNIYSTVFEQLCIPVEIRLNSRKILAALADSAGGSEKMMDITIAIDKLDKIGLEKVQEELAERGLDAPQIAVVANYLSIANRAGDNDWVLGELQKLFSDNATGKTGLDELTYILSQTKDLSSVNKIIIDPTLARGLNYYTGTIYEVKAVGVKIGSIGGGGRYDDLTGLFGVPNIPGVGISFGVDRIYDVMEELKLFPAAVEQGTKVLFFNLGEEESKAAYALLQDVRRAGTPAEIFHESQKFDKQFKYAEKKSIPYIVIIGSSEIVEKTAVIKDLRSGQQQKVAFDELARFNFV